MAATINLAGRVPTITRAISNRLVVVGVCLFLLLIGAIVFGFRYRFQRQAAREERQQTQTVASDAATSNRSTVEGQLPPSTLSGLPVVPGPNNGASQPTVPPSLPATSAPPQGPQAAPIQPSFAPATPGYDPSTSVLQANPRELQRTEVLSRRIQREQEAMEAPTGAQQQTSSSATSIDPAQAELDRLNAALRLPTSPAGTPAAVTPSTSLPIAEVDGAQGYRSQNGQAEKRQFAEGGDAGGDDYLKTTRTAPLSRWVVQRGTVIPAALPSKLVSDLPGDLIAEVVRDVYDSPTQEYVEIPAGSRLVGEYNSSVTYGQNRVQVVWTAIYFPDGSFVDLDRMPSHAADGSTGLRDQTDNHWKRVIGGVALSSLLAAGLQVSQNRSNGSVLTYPSTGQEVASAVGTQAAQLGEQITNRNLNIQPTLKIRPGEIFSVSVKKDIIFPGPYEAIVVK